MDYGTLLVFVIFGLIFGVGGLVVNAVLRPSHPNPVKNATYECGVDPIGDATLRYNLRFYVFALLYVVFAVESVFLFPWAVVYFSLAGWLPFVEILIFLFIVVLGLAYAWTQGVLQWD
jgi:NADH-quinone oxidoreductase subunit A